MITNYIWKGFGRKPSRVNLVHLLHVHKEEVSFVLIRWSAKKQVCKLNHIECASVDTILTVR